VLRIARTLRKFAVMVASATAVRGQIQGRAAPWQPMNDESDAESNDDEDEFEPERSLL
jgi:hypothetical protein